MQSHLMYTDKCDKQYRRNTIDSVHSLSLNKFNFFN